MSPKHERASKILEPKNFARVSQRSFCPTKFCFTLKHQISLFEFDDVRKLASSFDKFAVWLT